MAKENRLSEEEALPVVREIGGLWAARLTWRKARTLADASSSSCCLLRFAPAACHGQMSVKSDKCDTNNVQPYNPLPAVLLLHSPVQPAWPWRG